MSGIGFIRHEPHEQNHNFVKRFAPIVLFVSFISSSLTAQDLGFSDEADGSGGGSAPAVEIEGEVKASMTGFVDDFDEGADAVRLGDLFSGKLNFIAGNSRAKGVINLKIDTAEPPQTLRDVFDEAYLRAYFGKLDVEAGLRKLNWGKADSLGPLDVINPLDYSDMTDLSDALSDFMILKTARPLVHASLQLGQFSKLEGVFVPNFEPVRFAESGRWMMSQMALINQAAGMGFTVNRPDTATLDYFQAGLRFTTTIANAADIGFQYYYGRLTNPAADIPALSIAYNPYHQIGVDYAQVLAGFNIRAEFAANITEDLDGDDGAVYNPHLAWSLGFDRDLFWGVNLNVQCNETIRLLDGEVSDDPMPGFPAIKLDIEADSDLTATQITAALSKKFLHDELEVRAACLWEAENDSCIVMPALTWTKDDVAVELSAGIFAGSDDGMFGQFHDNSFVKAAVKYTF